jgi:hypothetical protein
MKPIESEDGHTYYTVDGIVPQQGPNYALAKRMQHWMVSNGVTVWSVVLVGVVLCSKRGCCIVLFFFLFFSSLFSGHCATCGIPYCVYECGTLHRHDQCDKQQIV